MKAILSAKAAGYGALIVTVFIVYTFIYLAQSALPGNPGALLGWWGWFDQGQYIASARSFADGSWKSFDHFYPPLYPWLGSLFIDFWPAHPFFLIDFISFALTILAMSEVAKQVVNKAWLAVAIIGTFICFPLLTLTQWEIPWTTSLSAGIGAALLLCLLALSKREWQIDRWDGWVILSAFSFLYGAIGAVRPLDIVVWLPVALTFYVKVVQINVITARSLIAYRKVLLLAMVILLCGIVVPAFYVYFNEITAGNIWGGYVKKIGPNGYAFHSILRKFMSIVFDSSPIYYEKGQSISDGYPILYLTIPATIYAFIRGKLVIKAICAAIFIQYMLYVPYSDLIPNGMFRYYNIHYFKWTFPWFSIFALAFILDFMKPSSWNRRWALGASAVVATCSLLLMLHLQAVPLGEGKISIVGNHEIDVTLDAPRRVDFVDIEGVQGAWTAIYFGQHKLDVDGVAYRNISMFRLLPTAQGVRLILARSTLAQTFKLELDDAVKVEARLVSARAAGVRLSLTCWLRSSCDLPTPVPMVNAPVNLSLADPAADRFVMSDWQDGEPWGRWTSAADATLDFRVAEPRDMTISVEVRPLLSASHPHASVSLTANDCEIGSAMFSYPDDAGPKVISGRIAKLCTPADGLVALHVRSGDVVTPRMIGINGDNRMIGIGVDMLKIQ